MVVRQEAAIVRDTLFCADQERYAQFIACEASGAGMGFIEAAVRTDYVNGTKFSPVVFLGDIYVVSEKRWKGYIARSDLRKANGWQSFENFLDEFDIHL